MEQAREEAMRSQQVPELLRGAGVRQELGGREGVGPRAYGEGKQKGVPDGFLWSAHSAPRSGPRCPGWDKEEIDPSPPLKGIEQRTRHLLLGGPCRVQWDPVMAREWMMLVSCHLVQSLHIYFTKSWDTTTHYAPDPLMSGAELRSL